MENQRQHFIPQFYLRGFSLYNKNTHLSIYQTAEKRFIPSGTLKRQGYEDYLYGKDGEIEKELSKIESVSAPILANAHSNRVLPAFQSDAWHHLLHFVILMSSRNP